MTRRPHPARAACPATLLAAALLTLLAGCGLTPPQPWEKDVLAKPEMRMDGDALEQRYEQHITTSKEAATGGYSVGGGGCGCN